MSFSPHHIEIDGGRLASSVRHDRAGPHPDYSRIGEFVFFVDIVEADGGRFGLWDGLSYDDAIRTAEVASREFGLESGVGDVIGGRQ
jgi:hypothetical protein